MPPSKSHSLLVTTFRLDSRSVLELGFGGMNLLRAIKGLKWSEVKVAQFCPTLCDPMDYTVHGILQARILEWVAFSFSRVSSQPRDQTQESNPGLPRCRQILYQLSYQGNLDVDKMLESKTEGQGRMGPWTQIVPTVWIKEISKKFLFLHAFSRFHSNKSPFAKSIW